MAAPNIKSTSTVNAIYGKTVGYAVTTSMAAALSNGASSGKVLKINSVYCANVDGASAADISLEHYDGTTGFAIGKTIAVPADATQVLVTREAYIYLEIGRAHV
jgi:hypothetical protein